MSAASARQRLRPPLPPMEAEPVDTLPRGADWIYEPKWDGFRCLAFRDGDSVTLQSKSGRPLERYFPDVADALRALAPEHFVLDAELLIPLGGRRRGASFEALQLRLHPAASRVARLAAEQPAHLLCFDLLVDPDDGRCDAEPFGRRRARLERFARSCFATRDGLEITEQTDAPARAQRWLAAPLPGQDGVMAKRRDAPYRSGERDAMQKVKRLRSADCVIGGFRRAGPRSLRSLLLGLYDEDGALHHVGHASSLSVAERRELATELDALAATPDRVRGFDGRAPGGPSRWTRGRAAARDWVAVPPRLVVEVAYQHFSGGRFRHGTQLVRRRPDKAPEQCGFDQIPKSMR